MVENGGVASAERRQQSARGADIPVLQQVHHVLTGSAQRRPTQGDKRRRRNARPLPERSAAPNRSPEDGPEDGDRGE